MQVMIAEVLVEPQRSLVDVLSPYGWVAVLSLIVTAIATPLCRELALRLGIVDKPDSLLKPHGRPIPYLGGVAIYLGWAAGLIALIAHSGPHLWLIGLLAGGGVVMLVGLADDIWNIAPRTKLAGQLLAAIILVSCGIGHHLVAAFLNPFGLSAPTWLILTASIPISLFLVVAASNATNLLDGMDGLCSGVTGILSLCFLALATHLAMYTDPADNPALVDDQIRIVASLAMFGAVGGFLPHNTNPARIFMGDAGSLLLGLCAAAMMLMFGERGNPRWVLGAVMMFGLPILDTSLALLRRLRLHRPIFSGDRSHLYDQLVDRGFTVYQTVAISYALAAFYGGAGLAIMLFVRTRYAIIIYAIVAIITLLACWKLGFLQVPRETAAEREMRQPREGETKAP